MLAVVVIAWIAINEGRSIDRVACDQEVDPARWTEESSRQQELRQQIAYQADDCGSLDGYTAERILNTLGAPKDRWDQGRKWFYFAGQRGPHCGFQSDSVRMVIEFDDDREISRIDTLCT